jgi:hypothetical protein
MIQVPPNANVALEERPAPAAARRVPRLGRAPLVMRSAVGRAQGEKRANFSLVRSISARLRRRRREASQCILDSVGLTGDFWQL